MAGDCQLGRDGAFYLSLKCEYGLRSEVGGGWCIVGAVWEVSRWQKSNLKAQELFHFAQTNLGGIS